MNLQATAVFLKKTAKLNIAIGILLSILANLLVQFIIPGAPVYEQVISGLISAIILLFQAYKEFRTEDGVVATIHRKYQEAR